uniref:Uncharacterized protein n=1 Tax=Nelumbo nucifera TaxID=4432 RepID=A0A822ZTV1_NELNU|nr:TPA_asm: hypothetical protein HUJ06_016666 [Nelumbo nucifera]
MVEDLNKYHLKDWTPSKMEMISTTNQGHTTTLSKTVLMTKSSHHILFSEMYVLHTLGLQITTGKTNWENRFHTCGDFRPIVGYLEWAELVIGRS